MLLNELYNRYDDQEDYRSPEEDETKQKMSDTRKTRLTLAHLNKLRVMNDARTVEFQEKIKDIQLQFKPGHPYNLMRNGYQGLRRGLVSS